MNNEVLGHGRPDFSAQFKPTKAGCCPACDGRGYTDDTATLVKAGRTTQRGSGCTTCKGVGYVSEG